MSKARRSLARSAHVDSNVNPGRRRIHESSVLREEKNKRKMQKRKAQEKGRREQREGATGEKNIRGETRISEGFAGELNERRLLERIKRGIAGEKNERKLKEKRMR